MWSIILWHCHKTCASPVMSAFHVPRKMLLQPLTSSGYGCMRTLPKDWLKDLHAHFEKAKCGVSGADEMCIWQLSAKNVDL